MEIVISMILLFLGIGVLVLIHVCIVGRAFRIGGQNNNNMVERGSFGSTSMSQDDIEKLPCFDFKVKEAAGGSLSPADCAVCLEKFKVGEKCRLLPSCNHSFHAECVDLWLLSKPICPICRTGADLWISGSSFGEGSNRYIDDQMAELGHGNELQIDIVSSETEDGSRANTLVEVSSRNEDMEIVGSQTKENIHSNSAICPDEVRRAVQTGNSSEVQTGNSSEVVIDMKARDETDTSNTSQNMIGLNEQIAAETLNSNDTLTESREYSTPESEKCVAGQRVE